MVAALLGAGAVADAFLVAFQLVNVVRRLLTEGALNAALVPAWLRLRETRGRGRSRSVCRTTARHGQRGADRGHVADRLADAAGHVSAGAGLCRHARRCSSPCSDARLMLPYLAFAGPVTVLMALMNARGRFALTAFSPLLFNIALIAVTIALLLWRQDAAFAAMVLAATVGIAGLLQLVDPGAAPGDGVAAWIRVVLRPRDARLFRKGHSRHDRKQRPAAPDGAGAIIASSSPSAVSWLYFASRLIELPLGIVGVAMGTVLVPELSRAVHGGDRAGDRACRIARAGARGRPRAAGDARTDRAQRADRAAAVRAWRVHRC